MNSVNLSRLMVVTLVGAACTGCAVIPPSTPTVMAVPGNGKTLNEFQQDDYGCRSYAGQVVDGALPRTARAGLAAPVAGAAGGAAAGALIGAGSGHAGAGAAFGAGAGLLLGSVAGGARQRGAEVALQTQFNNAYAQCITGKGDRIVTPPPPVAVMAPAPVAVVAPAPAVIYAPRRYYYVPY